MSFDNDYETLSDTSDSETEDIQQPIFVLDNGSHTIKSGFAGYTMTDNNLKNRNLKNKMAIFPTIIGSKSFNINMKNDLERILLNKLPITHNKLMSFPIKHGKIKNFKNMEILWESIFNSYNFDTKNNNIIMSETTLNPKKNREKCMEIIFENFQFKQYMPVIQPVLVLANIGCFNGCVVESGESTKVVPIIDGICTKNSYKTIKQLSIGGSDITKYFGDMLLNKIKQKRKENKKKYSKIHNSLREHKYLFEKIKEKVCFVYETNKLNINNIQYTLPDGKILKMKKFKKLRYKPYECFFKPELLNKESNGLHKLINQSIKLCDNKLTFLYKNIVLSGGNTIIKGFNNRLINELKNLTCHKINIIQKYKYNRKYATWNGGSLLGSISGYDTSSINKNEYNEYGNQILFKKCNYNVWNQK